MKITISKRKIESNKRAQKVAQHMRWLIARNLNPDQRAADLTISWMKVTGRSKFETP